MRRRPWIESKPERVAFARDLRGAPTDAEERLWYFLRSRRFQRAKFRRQVPVGPYVVDFLCVSASLVIEADGGQHSERAAYDEERTNYLEAKGYRVLRFWNNDVMRNIEGVMQVIAMTLTPGPSPKGEGSKATLTPGPSAIGRPQQVGEQELTRCLFDQVPVRLPYSRT